MKKIALLTDGIYPYVIGGMQKHSYYLAKCLARQKIYVDLYHMNNGTPGIMQLDCFNEEEKKYITSIVIDFPSGIKLPGHYIRASFRYSERIFDIFKNRDPVDFIYAKGFTAWKLLKEKQKGYECAPIGVNFHGYEMFQKAPDFKTWFQYKLLLRKPVLFGLRHADYLFSYGGKITDIIRRNTSQYHKIIEIPSGIDADWLNPRISGVNDPLKFIFVGRYERRKGVEELNKVLKTISPQTAFTFTIVGPIPDNKKVLINKINYTGSITDSGKLKALLNESDVLVCPSHSEGMPNVILEAMASGLAIIASDVGAVNKLVNDKNGILIDPANEVQLERALSRMLEMNVNELLLMKNSSLLKIKKDFIWDTIILKTIEEIDKRLVSRDIHPNRKNSPPNR